MTNEHKIFLEALDNEYGMARDVDFYKNKLQEKFGLSEETSMRVLRDYGTYKTKKALAEVGCY